MSDDAPIPKGAMPTDWRPFESNVPPKIRAESARLWVAKKGSQSAPRPNGPDSRTGPHDRADASGQRSLDGVLSAFDDFLLLPDRSPILVALAGIVANLADGDPVWPLLVGPPGCGKSEIITSLADAPGVWSLSSLTPQTLLSGAETSTGKPASLLLQIGAFGILAFKDLTTVLTMHREARAAIIGQLREVADGRCAKSFGTGQRIEWRGKLGLVAGVTPVIDEQHAFLAVMGERFLLFECQM